MTYLPQPGQQFGRYRIISRIGRGGMGSVFEARESGLDRPVALKVLSSDLADEASFRSRFLREARILASLDSPHVIQVYEQGEHDGRLYIATQLVKGSDLHQLIQASGPMAPADALGLVAQVAEGLSDAHAAGLLHRDVKPSNVLVRTDRDEPFAYLCDFGIAVQPDSHSTRTSGVIGTVDYMAPERHEGQDASIASDIYSLGCVLWAALTGKAPYDDTSAVRVAMAHMTQPLPVYTGDSPAADLINQVLTRSMAKHTSQRYTSAADIRRDLLSALDVDRGRAPAPDLGESITVTRPRGNEVTELRVQAHVPASTPAPARRRLRRGSLAAVGTVLAIALVGGTGYALASGEPDASDGATPVTGPAAQPTASASADGRDTAATPAVQQPQATATVTATVAPEAPAGSTQPQPAPAAPPVTATPAPAAPPASTVACWDGSTGTDRLSCGAPTGRAGLATVFPSLAVDSNCHPVIATVAGKAEVYECLHGNILLRYSRWNVGYDRYAYYDASNGLPGSEWYIGDEFAGRQWSSYDSSAGETRRYQWSASYRYSPFSVSVEGATEADRIDGKRLIQLALPSHIGLR